MTATPQPQHTDRLTDEAQRNRQMSVAGSKRHMHMPGLAGGVWLLVTIANRQSQGVTAMLAAG